MTGTEINILLSKLWKECPVQVKQAYKDREAREREIFKKSRAEWELKKDMALVEAATVSSNCHADAAPTNKEQSAQSSCRE